MSNGSCSCCAWSWDWDGTPCCRPSPRWAWPWKFPEPAPSSEWVRMSVDRKKGDRDSWRAATHMAEVVGASGRDMDGTEQALSSDTRRSRNPAGPDFWFGWAMPQINLPTRNPVGDFSWGYTDRNGWSCEACRADNGNQQQPPMATSRTTRMYERPIFSSPPRQPPETTPSSRLESCPYMRCSHDKLPRRPGVRDGTSPCPMQPANHCGITPSGSGSPWWCLLGWMPVDEVRQAHGPLENTNRRGRV
ncbi:hypothetical protein B0J13DRAFT_297429 [Dactylonectria estremocensis]|uniref:Uncharacterized protein n=1 Tax=Dactylonectria estremocensis TaxID=1079267 RepID=A0A9P9EZS3_9HYPO|nr:hypothetical protein B0J13DRAFT_297429 [Dactylonectria estremocensis]